MKVGFDGYFMADEKTAFGKIQRNLLKWLTIVDVEDEFFVFTDFKGTHSICANSKIHCIVVEKKRNDFVWRTNAIKNAIMKYKIKLDVYIETIEISPSLNSNIKIYSLQHDFSNGTLEKRFSLAHLKGLVYRFCQLKTIRKSDVVFCNSKYTMDQLLLMYPNKNRVILLGLDCDSIFKENLEIDSIKESINLRPLKQFFLFVGRIAVKHKNIPLLLETFDLFSKKYRNISLVIASTDNPTKVERNLMGKLGERLIFLQGLTTSEIATLYSQASAYIFPSLYEGFGIPILEAQHMGCPLLLNDIPIFREVSGGCAIFFNGEREDLFRAMEEIIDKNMQLKLKECGKINCKKYSWKNAAFTIHKQLLLEYSHEKI